MPAMEGMRHKTLQEASKGGRIPSGESKRPRKKVRGLMRLKMGSTYVVKGNQMLLGVWVWNDTLFCGVVVVLSDGYSFFFERELDLRNQDDIRTGIDPRCSLSSEIQTNLLDPTSTAPSAPSPSPSAKQATADTSFFFPTRAMSVNAKEGMLRWL